MTPALEGNGQGLGHAVASWDSLLETATREVFDIMLGTQLTMMPESDPSLVDLIAMVGMAGRLRGVLSLRCRTDVAPRIVSKMLGVEISEFDDSARDAMGEICNMVAGNFKAKLAGVGEECLLSVPTVVIGDDYELHSLSGERIEVCLGFEGLPLWMVLDIHNLDIPT